MVETPIEQSEGGWFTPELLRLKGELFLLQSRAAVRETAEDLFRQALDATRRVKALSWELRAATSLAQLSILRAGRPTGWQFSSQSTSGSPRDSTPRILNRRKVFLQPSGKPAPGRLGTFSPDGRLPEVEGVRHPRQILDDLNSNSQV